MTQCEIKNVIIEEFENLGIIIDEKEDDVDLGSLEIDSITFISFIVAIEDRFDIQLPDDFLTMEIMNSLNGFVNLIYEFLAV